MPSRDQRTKDWIETRVFESLTSEEWTLGDKDVDDVVTIEPSQDLKAEIEGLSDNTLALVRPGTYQPTGSVLPDNQQDVTVWFLPGAVFEPDHTNFGFQWRNGCERWHLKGGFYQDGGAARNTLFAVDGSSEEITISDVHVENYDPGSGAIVNVFTADHVTVRDCYIEVRNGGGGLNNFDGRNVNFDKIHVEAPADDGDAGLDLKSDTRATRNVEVSNFTAVGMLSGLKIGTEVNNLLEDVTAENVTARRCQRGVAIEPTTAAETVRDVDIDATVIDVDGVKMRQAVKLDDEGAGATIENLEIDVIARGRFEGTGGSATPFALFRGTYRDLDLDLQWVSGASANGNQANTYLSWQEFGTGTTDYDDVTLRLRATGGCGTDGLQILDDTNTTITECTIPDARINGATNRAIDDAHGVTAHVGELEADSAVNVAGGDWRIQDTNLGSGQQSTTVAINRLYAEALGGAAPTASNYPDGYMVRDTDNAGDVYMIAGGAATQIAT